MKAYHNTAILKFDDSTTGNAASGATITVRINSTQGLASMFNLADAAIANPMNTDSNGNYAFKVDDNIYDIIISEGTANEVKLEKVEISVSAINSVSVTYNFKTVALYKASTILFPVAKRIYLADRDAYFNVIAGTLTGNTSNILASAQVSQSIVLITNGIKNSKQWGAVGDFNPATNSGTSDTVVMQAMYASLQDNDEIQHVDLITLDRDDAVIQTVQGVASYILVANGIKNLKVTGTGTIYQKYNALDTVGVCYFDCDDLFLDMPVFDGNFRYLAAQPLSFKQQLLHLIQGKRHKGGFTVRNSANYGYLITNQYGVQSGYVESEVNNSTYNTVIVENCFQNTTFGTGVNRVIISSLSVLNPTGAAFKFSSLNDTGAPADDFSGVTIKSLNISFDSTFVIPNNEADTGLHTPVNGIDNVSSSGSVLIESAIIDFANAPLLTIGVKQVQQRLGDTTRRNGSFRVDYLKIKNQTVAGSIVALIDNEATGTSFGVIDYENVSKIIEIDEVESGPAQPKDKKWLNVGCIIGDDISSLALNVKNYDADYIKIGEIKAKYASGYTAQAVRIDATCDLNRLVIADIDTNSTVIVFGEVNDLIDIKGTIKPAAQAGTPLNVELTTLGSTRLNLSHLSILGNSDVGRRCFIKNVSDIFSSGAIEMNGCPSGFRIENFNLFRIGDNCNDFTGLTVTQPWQFGGSIGIVQGCFSYRGTPESTLIADMGCSYRQEDAGALFMKTSGIGTNTGWVAL
jgi:hypothetical protein